MNPTSLSFPSEVVVLSQSHEVLKASLSGQAVLDKITEITAEQIGLISHKILKAMRGLVFEDDSIRPFKFEVQQ